MKLANFKGLASLVVAMSLAIPQASAAQEWKSHVSVNEFGNEVFNKTPPKTGGSYTTAYITNIDALDPMASNLTAFIPVARAVFDTLVDYQADGSVRMNVLKSFTTEDAGKTWTMVLPEGRKFTDGTPFDAAAIKANIELMQAEGSRSRVAVEMRQIEALEIVDTLTLRITLKAAWNNFPKIFALNSSSANYVVSPKAYAELGERFGLFPVGSGPYMVKDLQPGSRVVLQRNPDYTGPRTPYADEVIVLSLPNEQIRLQAVMSGDLDIGYTTSRALLDEAEQNGLVALKEATYGYYNILFNLEKSPFNDRRIREAVIRAIDLNALNQAVFGGKAEPSKGFLPIEHPFAIDTGWPTYDSAKAKALFDDYATETGWNRKIQLMHTSNPDFQKQAALVQQMLKAVGVEASIEPADQPTMVKNVVNGSFEAQLRNAFVFPETDMNLYNTFHGNGASNNSRASDPAVDAILSQLRQETDPVKRRALIGDMQQAFAAWLPIAPLNMRMPGVFLSDRIGGFPGFIGDQDAFDLDKVWLAD